MTAADPSRRQAMFGQPASHVVVVVLLGPQHAGQGLAHDAAGVFAQPVRRRRGVEGVRLCLPRF